MTSDRMSRAHVQDTRYQIKQMLNPNWYIPFGMRSCVKLRNAKAFRFS